MKTTQLEGACDYSHVAVLCHAYRCSAGMPDVLPDLLSLRLRTTLATSSPPGTESLTGNGSNVTGMLRLGRVNLWYISTQFNIILVMVTQAGRGGDPQRRGTVLSYGYTLLLQGGYLM